jgi:hypothetical protein
MAIHAKSEAESVERRSEMSRIIDKNRDIVHLIWPDEWFRRISSVFTSVCPWAMCPIRGYSKR